MEQNNTNIFENGLDEMSKAYLQETTRWTKFLAVMGFIFTGLLIIAALAIMTLGSVSSAFSSGFGGMGAGIGFLYLVVAALYLYPAIALFKFSSCMKRGINSGSQDLITEAFRHQKNMYRFIGILMVLMIAVYLLIFVFAGLGIFSGSTFQ